MSYKARNEQRVYQSLQGIRTIAYSGIKFSSGQRSSFDIIDEW